MEPAAQYFHLVETPFEIEPVSIKTTPISTWPKIVAINLLPVKVFRSEIFKSWSRVHPIYFIDSNSVKIQIFVLL